MRVKARQTHSPSAGMEMRFNLAPTLDFLYHFCSRYSRYVLELFAIAFWLGLECWPHFCRCRLQHHITLCIEMDAYDGWFFPASVSWGAEINALKWKMIAFVLIEMHSILFEYCGRVLCVKLCFSPFQRAPSTRASFPLDLPKVARFKSEATRMNEGLWY